MARGWPLRQGEPGARADALGSAYGACLGDADWCDLVQAPRDDRDERPVLAGGRADGSGSPVLLGAVSVKKEDNSAAVAAQKTQMYIT